MRKLICLGLLLVSCQKKGSGNADSSGNTCAAPSFGVRTVVFGQAQGAEVQPLCLGYAVNETAAVTTIACMKAMEAATSRVAWIQSGNAWAVRPITQMQAAPRDLRNGWIMGPGSIDLSYFVWDQAVSGLGTALTEDVASVPQAGRLKTFQVLSLERKVTACPELKLGAEQTNTSPFALNLPIKVGNQERAVEFLSFQDECQALPGALLLSRDGAGVYKPLGLYARPYLFYEEDCHKRTESIFTNLETAVIYAKETFHGL